MSRPHLVASADLHYEYNAYVSYPQMWGDSYFAGSQLFDKAIELRVPLLLAGDLFDKAYPDSYSLRQMFNQLDRMKEAGLPVYYLQGQHEMSRRQPWLSLHSWPIHIHEKLVIVGPEQWRLYGLDFQPADKLAAALSKVPENTDILACHQVWGEFMGEKAAPEGWLGNVRNAKMIITGDYHVHTALTVTNAGGTTQVLSPGSTTLQSLSEDPIKHAYILHRDFSFESFQLQNREVCRVRIVTSNQLDTMVALFQKDDPVDTPHLPLNIRKPICHIEFMAELPDAHQRLKDAVGNKAHLFLRPFSGKMNKEDLPAAPVTGLVGALHHAGIKDDHPLFATSARLLNSPDVKTELQQIVTEWLTVATNELDN